MRPIAPLLAPPLLLCALLLGACGGDSQHVALVKETNAAQQELIEILEGVDDAESAESAAAQITRLGETMRRLSAELEALPEPSEEQVETLQEFMPSEEDMGKVMGEMLRVMQIPGAMEHLEPAFAALQQGE